MWEDSRYCWVVWCFARTAGFTRDRTFSFAIGSLLPKPMPTLLLPLSINALGSGAILAVRSMYTSLQRFGDMSKEFLNPSLHIRCFGMKTLVTIWPLWLDFSLRLTGAPSC